MVNLLRTAFKLLTKLCTEFLVQTLISIGLLIILGSAYSQFMIGLAIGVVIFLIALILLRTM